MIQATTRAFLDFIRGRKLAYVRVLDKDNQFTKDVLRDLARFCRAHRSTFHPDARVHAMLEGRREVWLRIVENLNLTEDELFELHTVRDPKGQK